MDDFTNTFRILVATDNHLGYKETDPVIGEDSFESFEFILKKAKELNVDFLLLGGDLFDANKPSRNTMNKTIKLLNQYCLGSGDINFTYLPTDDSPLAVLYIPVNYEDDNLNITLPIFAIHGNHDDPIREGPERDALSALDILSSTRLINYFARINNIDNIQIKPMLFQKGSSKLAIYGMGYVPDERLSRMFEQHHVTFFQPPEDDDWFHLFIIHQNCESGRAKRTLRLDLLPRFLQLVIWGHEHECKIDPSWNDEGQFYTMQPGSSCVTSLIEAETVPKKIALIEIQNKEFRVNPIAIPCMRKFIYESISLSNYPNLDNSSPTITLDIESILDDVMVDILDKTKNETKLPLVRIAVDITGFPPIPIQIYGAKYVGKIANPSTLLLLKHKRIFSDHASNDNDNGDVCDEFVSGMAQFDMMASFIDNSIDDVGGLDILNKTHLRESLSQYVNKGCSTSWNSMLNHFDNLVEETLASLDLTNANVDNVVKVIKDKYSHDEVCYLSNLEQDIDYNTMLVEEGNNDDDEPAPKRTKQRKRTTASRK